MNANCIDYESRKGRRIDDIIRAVQEFETPDASTRRTSNAHPEPLRVVTFDGGPLAPLSLQILDYLEGKHRDFLAKSALFCGVSDGALVALALSYNLEKLGNSREAIRATKDFEKEVIGLFTCKPSNFVRLLVTQRALYGDTLRRFLERYFGTDTCLCALKKYPVAVFAYSASAGQVVNFTSVSWLASHTRIVDAAVASCAFPLLFPIVRMPPPDGERLLDGGLANNDPSLAALGVALEALRVNMNDLDWILTARRYIPYLRILSLGAAPEDDESTGKRQELLGNLYRMVDLLIAGPSTADNQFCQQVIGAHRYKRFQPKFPVSRTALSVLFRTRSGIEELLKDYEHRGESSAKELANREHLAQQMAESVNLAREFQGTFDDNLDGWIEHYWQPNWAEHQKKHW